MRSFAFFSLAPALPLARTIYSCGCSRSKSHSFYGVHYWLTAKSETSPEGIGIGIAFGKRTNGAEHPSNGNAEISNHLVTGNINISILIKYLVWTQLCVLLLLERAGGDGMDMPKPIAQDMP